MSKSKYFGKKDPTPAPTPTGTQKWDDVKGERFPPEKVVEIEARAKRDLDDGIAPGQVYEGVKVPDRAINTMGLTPGATLGPLVIDAPYTQTNDGWWYAFFEGEGCTGITLYVDAEMLKTGKLRK